LGGHVVLLGDSIFDNAAYTGREPDVVQWDASAGTSRTCEERSEVTLPSTARRLAFQPQGRIERRCATAVARAVGALDPPAGSWVLAG
jgi:hypothetical protein